MCWGNCNQSYVCLFVGTAHTFELHPCLCHRLARSERSISRSLSLSLSLSRSLSLSLCVCVFRSVLVDVVNSNHNCSHSWLVCLRDGLQHSLATVSPGATGRRGCLAHLLLRVVCLDKAHHKMTVSESKKPQSRSPCHRVLLVGP